MTMPWAHIAISGELGTGKSSVARLVSERAGFGFLSSGDVHRLIAEKRGISTVELNHLAEEEDEIDAQIDGELARLGREAEPTVFDSRLAWHFTPNSLKVHLIADFGVTAKRLFGDRANAVESYAAVEDAAAAARSRQTSERDRFLEKYGVDIWHLGNYDLVIDTTEASIGAVADHIEEIIRTHDVGSKIRVNPRRVFPTGDAVRELAAGADDTEAADSQTPLLGYSRPYFFVVRGHRGVAAALGDHAPLMDAELVAEGDEPVVGGIAAKDYLRKEAKPSWLYDWEDANGFKFLEYPALDDWRAETAAR